MESTGDTVGENDNKRKEPSMCKDTKDDKVQMFICGFCSIQERYDYKGTRPPFAQQITYSEDCYVMKDPFSLPNKGETLVLGANCSICKQPVCLSCSIYFGKRFCAKCASSNMSNFPTQLHSKIVNLVKNNGS